jgi:hypothetical protein
MPQFNVGVKQATLAAEGGLHLLNVRRPVPPSSEGSSLQTWAEFEGVQIVDSRFVLAAKTDQLMTCSLDGLSCITSGVPRIADELA